METINNRIPEQSSIILKKLRNFIDLPIYYYGSCQRFDYFPNHSDIDGVIFTDNIESLKSKLKFFFNSNKISHVIKNIDNKNIHGYKIHHKHSDTNFRIEISVYNEKYKNKFLDDCKKQINLSYISVILLFLLKTFYYIIPIIDSKSYIRLKSDFLHLFNKKNLFVNLGYPKNK